MLCHVGPSSFEVSGQAEFLSRICLVTLFDTGEVSVNYLISSSWDKGIRFSKFELATACPYVHPKVRVNKAYQSCAVDGFLGRASSIDGSLTASPRVAFGLSHPSTPRAEFHDVAARSLSFKLQRTGEFHGQRGILIPGSSPCFLTAVKGFPHISQISFPELPFSNFGRYFLTPLSCGSNVLAKGSGIYGIGTLWHEIQAVHPSTARPTAKCLFGLYQQPTSFSVRGDDKVTSAPTIMTPNSGLSVKRVSAGSTLKFIMEMLPRSDDKTELALLQKKVYVSVAESTETSTFLPNVLTDKEIELEEQMYDRFFGNLSSFKQPVDQKSAATQAGQSGTTASTFGPPPLLQHLQNKICLILSGSVVDEYTLPVNECVLGMEVLYLTLEKKPDAAVANAVNMAIGRNIVTSNFVKRVFVCVGTHVVDKHGEDTQGEGRLLLFTLDYKVADPAMTEFSSEQAVTGGLTVAQDQFLHSITPKLRLQWQGPGPSSICKQFGENILSTVGANVYIYKLNPDTLCLEQISFYFGQVKVFSILILLLLFARMWQYYISSASVLRNYIMLCDVCNSVQFLVWREDDYTLTPLAKDLGKHVYLSSSYIWDGSSVGMLLGDNEANIEMMQFDPRYVVVVLDFISSL
jgi:hypothetical protein